MPRLSLAVSLASLVVLVAACAKPKLSDVTPRDRRVLFIGVDGLDFEMLTPVLKSGFLPKLAELRSHGLLVPIQGERATVVDPSSVGLDPAESWTTIATGFPAVKATDEGASHGVRELVGPMKGRYETYPVTSQHRRLPTFWDVLGAAGVKCAIVGWWTTWPAEPVNGWMVSDRFFLEEFGLGPYGAAGRVDLPTVPDDYRHGAEHLTWPEDLGDPLARELRGKVEAAAGPTFDALREFQRIAKNAGAAATTTWNALKQLDQALRTDYAVKEAMVSLLRRDRDVRFAACYLDSFDVAAHQFFMHISPADWQQSKIKSVREKLPPDFAKYSSVIPATAHAIDGLIAELCTAMGPDTIVVLTSDHTFERDAYPDDCDFNLNRLLEEVGLLVRKPDGAVDWSKTTCFDRTVWPHLLVRELALNVEGEWPQGWIKAGSPEERAARWQEVWKVLDVQTNTPWSEKKGDPVRYDLAYRWEPSSDDAHYTLMPPPILNEDTKVKVGDRDVTYGSLFPMRPTSGRHHPALPGMLLLSHPGAVGEAQGKRGIPMGKGGGQSRHIAPLILALYGIPPSASESESSANADLLFWMLSGDEPQRMVLMPRVESYEDLVRFGDPSGRLGRRRAELSKYLDDLGFDFAKWRAGERRAP